MPPAKKKKPTARAKAGARARARPKPAARAKTTGRKSVARKPTPRASTARAQERPRVEIKRSDVEQPARPVAVSEPPPALWESVTPTLPEVPSPSPVAPSKPSSPVVDKPWAELGVGVVAVLLAGSVFLPWYHNALTTVSGWSSGTWGPVIFFLALAALAIVVLRRMQIPVAFPVEAPLVVEAIGWICVIGLILKRYFQPTVFATKLPSDGWIFASLACALGLAILAGTASSNTAFVLRPRWFSGTPGWIGSAVLALALAGGLALGFTNTSVPTAGPVKPAPQPTQIRGLPACAKRLNLPTPQGFTAYVGYESSTCIATWYTSLGLNKAYSRYTTALRTAHWTVTDAPQKTGGRSATLRGPACGNVSVAAARLSGKAQVVVEVITYRCQAAPK
jgi:hypothetical protein